MAKTAGYSSTPLATKLGIKEGFHLRLINVPQNYLSFFDDWPANVVIEKSAMPKKDLIHFFTKEAAQLFVQLPLLRDELKQAGMIWVSWPKKASKVTTDITEEVIRDLALQNGLVDVKVCAVNELWSGLKLVIPVRLRKTG